MKNIKSVILVVALLALVGCNGSPSNSDQAPPEDYVNRYPGEYNTEISDYSNIQIKDNEGNDISHIAIDLWYAANEIYNVDDMKMFEIGEYETNLMEYDIPQSNELVNYYAIVENIFTQNGITQLEQTRLGASDGSAPLIRKQDGKVYRMGAWKSGYSFANALTDMQVKEFTGNKITLAVTYASINRDNTTVTVDFTITIVDGTWLVDDYVYPESFIEQPIYDEAEIKAQFEQAVEACYDVINEFNIDVTQSAYPMPTPEEYTRMSEAIGALGFPVAYYDLDMPNYEKVVAFWEDAQAGKDAQTVIYCLYNWGITADILVNRNGEQFSTMAVYDFPQETMDQEPEISFREPLYKIDDLRMTEKGYLLYHITAQDDLSEMYGGYRLSPLGEEKRALGRKYVWGIGYLGSNMLRDNWDEDNLSVLKMDWVFESLYYKINGHLPYEDYPDSGAGDSRVLIPADVMESVMLSSFPLTAEQLREFIPYDQAGKTYAYLTFNGGGYSGLPEVVEAVRNADGTLTLTIDAVAIEFGKDKSMTSVLTVIDNTDGSIKYLSNTAVVYE